MPDPSRTEEAPTSYMIELGVPLTDRMSWLKTLLTIVTLPEARR